MNLEPYLKAFAKLRVDKNTKHWSASTTYRAPHKPFLLLSILDLFAQGIIQSNLIEITPELGGLFADYWSKVFPPDYHGNLALPFFHLRSSGFWHLIPRPNCEEELLQNGSIETLNYLNRLVIGAKLDEDLFDLLYIEEARNELRRILIQTYFAPEFHPILLSQGKVNLEAFQYSQQLIYSPDNQTSESMQPRHLVRDQGFHQAIVHIYNHRCAFCGIRMMTTDGHSVIEAAHIIPWSISHNDIPDNGIALCRLCHWTFDEGLTSISNSYLVLLSPELRSTLNMAGQLLALENRAIIGPDEKDLWPNPESLKWHRQNMFRNGE